MREQDPTHEVISLRATDQVLSSQMAGTESIKVITMGALTGGPEEMSTLGSGPHMVNTLETRTLEISAQAHGAPTTQGINTMEAADTSAPRQQIRLFPNETRSFNYAMLKEDDVPQLHALSFKEYTSNNAQGGSEHTRDDAKECSERARGKG
jgi:hypothetical protein